MNSQPGLPLPPVNVPGQADPDGRVAELERSVQRLSMQVRITLGLLVLLVAVFNLFLYQQTKILNYQKSVLTAALQPVSRGLGDHRTNTVPLMERFAADMVRFGQFDSNFAAQILAKYPPIRGQTNNPAPPTAP
ncbi:MAG: hypothetical protein ACYDC1_16600 [Limisphaerales bacterium]